MALTLTSFPFFTSYTLMLAPFPETQSQARPVSGSFDQQHAQFEAEVLYSSSSLMTWMISQGFVSLSCV